jgi:hypothetical protein
MFISLGVIMGVIASCSTTPANEEAQGSSFNSRDVGGEVEASYEYVPYERMLRESDSIIVAQVESISNTRWNQDSGEYWEQTLVHDGNETIVTAHPYYEIGLSVQEVLADVDGAVDDQISIVVIGASPLDYEEDGNGTELSIGDNIVSFNTRREIGWRNQPITYDDDEKRMEIGRKLVHTFTGSPDTSYLIRGEDGLYYDSSSIEEFGPISIEALRGLIKDTGRR